MGLEVALQWVLWEVNVRPVETCLVETCVKQLASVLTRVYMIKYLETTHPFSTPSGFDMCSRLE
jgi:hypothetical protein